MKLSKRTRLYLSIGRQALAGGLVVAFGIVAIFNAGSNLLVQQDYRLAARLNPFNLQAHLLRLNRSLELMDSAEKAVIVEGPAKWAITLSPRDPRGFSALGLARAQSGNIEAAKAFFEHALEMSTSEPVALRWLAWHHMGIGEYERSLDLLVILERRWPDLYRQTLPIYSAMLSRPAGMAALTERHITRTASRKIILEYLVRTPEGAQLAAQYLLRLHKRGAERLGTYIVNAEHALFKYGYPELALSLFQFTLNPRAKEENGFVFNADFALTPSGSPFDWTLLSTPGVAQAVENGTLSLRFLNGPTRLASARQVLMLSEGRYVLQVRLDAEEAKTPDPVYAELRCRTRLREQVASILLPDGEYRNELFEIEFTVPPGRCQMQTLQLTNRVSTLNWSRPNSGTLRVQQLAIQRAGSV